MSSLTITRRVVLLLRWSTAILPELLVELGVLLLSLLGLLVLRHCLARGLQSLWPVGSHLRLLGSRVALLILLRGWRR